MHSRQTECISENGWKDWENQPLFCARINFWKLNNWLGCKRSPSFSNERDELIQLGRVRKMHHFAESEILQARRFLSNFCVSFLQKEHFSAVAVVKDRVFGYHRANELALLEKCCSEIKLTLHTKDVVRIINFLEGFVKLKSSWKFNTISEYKILKLRGILSGNEEGNCLVASQESRKILRQAKDV